jgi:hypothetical protein
MPCSPTTPQTTNPQHNRPHKVTAEALEAEEDMVVDRKDQIIDTNTSPTTPTGAAVAAIEGIAAAEAVAVVEAVINLFTNSLY